MPAIGKVVGQGDSFIFLDSLEADSPQAVVRIQIEQDYVLDLFMYLTFDTRWKFIAFRSMALPGFTEQCNNMLPKGDFSPQEEQASMEIQQFFTRMRSGEIGICTTGQPWISCASKPNNYPRKP